MDNVKYLTVKNLSAKTTINKLFAAIKKQLEEDYKITFKSKENETWKYNTLAIKLENGELITHQKDDKIQSSGTLEEHYITRFSTIKVATSAKVQTSYPKAGEDFILIKFPDYIRKEPLKLPLGNGSFTVEEVIEMVHKKAIIEGGIKGFENIKLSNFGIFKLDASRQACALATCLY